ncbi:MAG: Tad domain-containing protein, partial [Alphaproteobacteria bacterium]
ASALAIIGFAALAVDGARAHILRSQLHYAVDSAAIAIGKEMNSLDADALQALAERYVEANVSPSLLGVSGNLGAEDLTVQVLDGDNDNRKEIRATAKLRTVMLGMLDGAAMVDISRSATVQREIKGLELAFALDVTGSMEWDSGTPGMNRMEALKAAATDMLNIIFGDNAVHPKVWISVTPFTRSVQAQTNVNWVKSTTMNPPLPYEKYNQDFDWNPTPDFAGGDSFCYGARDGL